MSVGDIDLFSFLIVTFKTGRSPIFAHTNATISGLTTIRAYRSDEAIISEFNSLQDSNSSVCFLFNASARALAMWLEIVCVLYMTVVVVIFFIFETGNCWKVNSLFFLSIIDYHTTKYFSIKNSIKINSMKKEFIEKTQDVSDGKKAVITK